MWNRSSLSTQQSNFPAHFSPTHTTRSVQVMMEEDKKENLSTVLRSAGDLRLEDRPIPNVKEGEVMLAMQSVGICGSDIHFYTHGKIGHYVMEQPMVMGHEACGLVVATGHGVTNVKVGDRVAIEPGIPCRMCSFCKGGKYNLCPDVKFGSCPPYDGFLCRYTTHAADFCYALPENVSSDEGALLEPLSVGVQACLRAGVSLGHRVLVCGAGPIGLVCMLTAKAFGATSILITDLDDGRLKIAKELGATHTVQVAAGTDSADVATMICSTMGCQPDITIECSGAAASLATAIHATVPGGALALVGMGAAQVEVPLITAGLKELDIRGVLRYSAGCYAKALEMVASGKVNVKPLITHTYKLEESLQAFQTAKSGQGGAIKVMIRCNKD